MPRSGDRRDDTNWVVLELTRAGEVRVADGTLEPAIREALGSEDHPVFIPATTYFRGGRRVTVHLMEGYVFVASGLPETTYLNLERDCPYVRRALSSRGEGGIPVLSVISDRDVQDMRRKLRETVSSDIRDGMKVRINQGTYAKLDGTVVDVEGDEAQVLIELRSFKVIRGIPRAFLEPATED